MTVKRHRWTMALAIASFFGCSSSPEKPLKAPRATVHPEAGIVEYPLDWSQVGTDAPLTGSTHEITFDRTGGGDSVWITGQNYDGLVRVHASGEQTYFAMPKASGPHGLAFDADGQLLVSLEFEGSVATVSETGELAEVVDIAMKVDGLSKPINPAPHGIAVDKQGTTTWFTGKRTSTIGRILPDGSVEHFELETLAAMPIYLHPGPQGDIWGTELLGNKILRIDSDGNLEEYPIPTKNSRPIAIALGPDNNMWFSEEAGRKVARITASGEITEFDVPVTQKNMLLAGLAFDDQGNLWTQGYVDPNEPQPSGDDYIIRIHRDIVDAQGGDMSSIQVDLYRVPTRNTIMHRIVQGPDGNIWFTELGTDKLGILPLP